MLIHPKIEDGIAQLPNANDQESSWKVGQLLTIGEIVTHKGESVDSLMLEPQGIAHLISEECVHLPDDVCGLAHVLTRMCNEGLLTLDIGVVDPGWKNRLSTPILNFSSEKRLLQKGDKFIRITFHQVEVAEGASKESYGRARNTSREEYSRAVRARSVGNFGKNFLNIRQLVSQASKKENARMRETMLKYLPIGAFSLAFFALMVTVGVATVARLANDRQDELLQRIKVLEAKQQMAGISPHETPRVKGVPSKTK